MDGLGDSLDLVPIAGYMGEGKRSGAFGAYLLASYDLATDTYQPVGKLGSGFSDTQLEEWHSHFVEGPPGVGAGAAEGAGRADGNIAPPAHYKIDLPESGLPPQYRPHSWLEPRVVWEVKAAALSLSPVFRAARGTIPAPPAEASRGLGLRFPRFLRARPDKAVVDATTSNQLAAMFALQPEGGAATAAAAAAATAASAEAAEAGRAEAGRAESEGAEGAEAEAEAEVGTVQRGVMDSKSGGKFWEGRVEGSTLTVRWGKVGAAGQTKSTQLESEGAATVKLRKQRAEKEKKGYVFRPGRQTSSD